MDDLIASFDFNGHYYELFEKSGGKKYLKSYSAKAKMTVIMPIEQSLQDVSIKQKANELRDYILNHLS